MKRIPHIKAKRKAIRSEELWHSVNHLAAKSKALSAKIMSAKQAGLFSMFVYCSSVSKLCESICV